MNDLCESPIETKLLEAITPLLHESITLQPQQRVKNNLCNYRVDFRVDGCERVIIECDGRDFHDYYDDKARDLNILRSGEADWIIRFRGCDIHYEPDACVEMLLAFFPWFGDGITTHPRNAMDVSSSYFRIRFGNIRAVARGTYLLRNLQSDASCPAEHRLIMDMSMAAFDGKFALQFIAKNWSHDKGAPARKEQRREARRQKVEGF